MRNARDRRAAFTMIEMSVALVGATALIAGMTGALLVAVRATDTASHPLPARAADLAVLADLQSDLWYATSIVERTPTAITVLVPDRSDPDSLPEQIRYFWSGVAGEQLLRKLNTGSPAPVAENVQHFAVAYSAAASPISSLQLTLRTAAHNSLASSVHVRLPNQP